MPKILSVGVCNPPNKISQEQTTEFIKNLFQEKVSEIHRLLKVFENGDIQSRYFCESLDWYAKDHSFEEKNNTYIEKSIEFGVQAIQNCLTNQKLLKREISSEEIDAFFFVSSTGIATPSIDARIMNKMNFSAHTKKIPIWGLGCAGGASGLARAYEYCKAFPTSKVLLLSVELCSLTFQKNDFSKSNLIGTSLFADGIAAVCMVGDEVKIEEYSLQPIIPTIVDTQSTLMKDSEEVMGWDVKNEGLYVIFSKDIPSIVRTWLFSNVEQFLTGQQLSLNEIRQFVAHPGGKKVLDAYEHSLNFTHEMTAFSREVLQNHGNMSSATVLYVLNLFMERQAGADQEFGLVTALGPGFSSELLLLQWEEVV